MTKLATAPPVPNERAWLFARLGLLAICLLVAAVQLADLRNDFPLPAKTGDDAAARR